MVDNDQMPSREKQEENTSKTSRFQGLEAEKQRREGAVASGLRFGMLGLVVAILGGSAYLVLDTGAKKPVEETVVPSANESATTKVVCDAGADYTATPDHPCNLQAEFQAKYGELITGLLPQIEQATAEEFVREDLAAIQDIETNAIKAFDRSDFANAIHFVEEATTQSKSLITKIAQSFQESFSNAQMAFENNNPDTAQEWINRALRLNGQDTATQNLAARISVLPQVLTLYQKAAEAEVQNQLLDLYTHLENIVQLDPQREDVRIQMTSLAEQLKEARYTDFLRQATQHIANGDTNAARTAVDRANGIYSGRGDTVALVRQINEIEKQRRIANMLTAAQNLIAQDNWIAAQEQFAAVLGEDSTNAEATTGRNKAARIIEAYNRVTNMLNNQIRMQDEKIHQRIVDFVDVIKPLSSDSVGLAAHISTLEQTLTQWQQQQTVTVLSDGKSFVKVRRIGNVGEVTQRDIQLKPGEYDFECTRSGYRSKLVKHLVSPGAGTTTVKISCDVPL